MDQSILTSIKKLLGIDASYSVFDTDIVIFINSAFSILHQIGAAPSNAFRITGDTEKWSDFIDDVGNVDMVRSYVYLKVRLVFDPPTTSFAIAAFENQIKELESRLNMLELNFDPSALDYQNEVEDEETEKG